MNTPETPLTYILEDVNTQEKMATLKVREQGKRSGYVFSNVSISGQLASRIQMKRDNKPTFNGKERMQLENVEFTSKLQSPSYEENPLKLIKFIDEEGGKYHVQLVTDKGFKVFKYKNAAQKMVEKIVYLSWKANQYIRYWEVNLIKQ